MLFIGSHAPAKGFSALAVPAAAAAVGYKRVRTLATVRE